MSLRLRPGVLVTGREGAWFVTVLATGGAFEVNETAVRVVEAIRGGADEEGCVRALAAAFPDVPADEVERDVRGLVADLVAAGVAEAVQ